MSYPIQRRQWLQSVLLASGTAGFFSEVSAQPQTKQADRLRIAVIGLGGQGKANLKAIAGENIVALCDVDEVRAGDAYERFPRARKFQDYRVLFDRMAKEIDAVVISTPDHTHFHPARQAILLGKHVYLEKPMAHSVWEVRELTRLAAEKKVATQLGVQRHTLRSVHDAVEILRAGTIGKVTEVHSWISGQRGMPALPKTFPPLPQTLQWDLWLGPASARPYAPEYVPYNWRFWWDFGTGETGNWGCHILDIPFWALRLRWPRRVRAEGPPPDAQRSPRSMHVTYEFPAEGDRAALTLHWYHGTPPILKTLGIGKTKANNLFVGDKGMLLAGFDTTQLLPAERFKDFVLPARTIAKSPGFHAEWLQACRGGKAATCDFAYTGPLTETVLLGNVAYRAGAFDWNAGDLKASTLPAQGLIRPTFRKGWEV